jgi:hypothetical protein
MVLQPVWACRRGVKSQFLVILEKRKAKRYKLKSRLTKESKT